MKIDGENIQNLFEDDDGKKKKNFEKIQMWKEHNSTSLLLMNNIF